MTRGREKLQQASRYSAQFRLTAYGFIEGYIYHPDKPEISVTAEVYCDGAFIGLARADNERPLTDRNQPFHGLNFQAPPRLLSPSATFAVQVANMADVFPVRIDQDLREIICGLHSSRQERSRIVYNGGGIIRGWIQRPEPSEDNDLRVFCDGSYLCAVELIDKVPWTRDHEYVEAFRVELPARLYDGEAHLISIRDLKGEEIYGSPVEILLERRDLATFIHEEMSAPGQIDDQRRRAFFRILKSFEDRYPRSIGFSLYEDWRALRRRHLQIDASCGDRILVLALDSRKGDRNDKGFAAKRREYLDRHGIRTMGVDPQNITGSIFSASKAFDYIFPVWDFDEISVEEMHEFIRQLKSVKALVAYSDVDFIVSGKKRTNPWFRPAFDETMFLSLDYLSRGLCLTRAALEAVSLHFRYKGRRKPPDWDAFLFAALSVSRRRIAHIPQILYSCREDHRSFSLRRQSCRPLALRTYLEDEYRINSPDIRADEDGLLHIQWPLPAKRPKVSIIIPTRDSLALLANCISSVESLTDYENYELIIINNQSSDPEVIAYLSALTERGVRVIDYDRPFNYSDMHNCVMPEVSGSIICLMNNDICVLDPGWLTEMVSQLMRKKVGAVGAKLLWPNKIVQHAGVIVGVDGLAAHIGNYLSADEPGYFWCNALARELSAVTAACMLVRKADFLSVGGFDANLFPIAFNDVDLCLRLRQKGLKIVWTPFARLTHLESASRASDVSGARKAQSQREERAFRQKWTTGGWQDRFYSPNLGADYMTGPYGGLAMRPTIKKPRFNDL
jgi:GT2 family glycosyltransferase